MNERVKIFIVEYVGNKFNATEAAKRAGYSEKTAYSQGQRLLKNVEVKAGIAEYIKTLLKDTDELTYEWLEEVRKLAFEPIEYRTGDKGQKTGDNRSDKLKALDILGKYLSLYSEHRIVSNETKEDVLSETERKKRIAILLKKLDKKISA